MRVLLVDNYDSYTYNLFDLLEGIPAVEPEVRRNDELPSPRAVNEEFGAVVVSPGPGRPQHKRDLGDCGELIREFDGPLLGVCLGLQGIVHSFGGTVAPAPVPVHGHATTVRHRGGALFAGIPDEFQGVRYHSLAATEPLPSCLRVTARSEDGVVMALEHRTRPIWGVQFHPESVGTPAGPRLLRNFIDQAANARRDAPRARPTPAAAPSSSEARRLPPSTGFRRFERELNVRVDPARAFVDLFASDPFSFWLDGQGEGGGEVVLGTAAGTGGEVLYYRAGEGTVRALDPPRGTETELDGTVFEVLRRRRWERRVEPAPSGGFGGGYVGYLGYELKADLGSRCSHRAETPDACLMFASSAVVLEPGSDTVRAIRIAPPGLADGAADAELDSLVARLQTLADTPAPRTQVDFDGRASAPAPPPELGLSKPEYIAAVEAAQRALLEGESYEVCLTDTARVELGGFDPLASYLRQRLQSPAPYGAYLQLGGTRLLSFSPERFLAVTADGAVESKPIKGTRPRGRSAVEDGALRDELARSAKDRAENLMVVDLVRNDLARVCESGSVAVPSLMAVETFAHVHQLVSTVRGRLRPDRDSIDCIESCFPPGSMTGAPKLRTMEIIDALEPAARGVYSGVHGYLGSDGSADLGVVIRSLVVTERGASAGAGGAITVLSDPGAEYEEMRVKLAPLLESLERCADQRPALSSSP